MGKIREIITYIDERRKIIAFGVSALILLTLLTLSGGGDIDTAKNCCESVCAQAGLKCHDIISANEDNTVVRCRFNYGRYGHPEVTELFWLEINDTSICTPSNETFDRVRE